MELDTLIGTLDGLSIWRIGFSDASEARAYEIRNGPKVLGRYTDILLAIEHLEERIAQWKSE